jgi:hypothetical protein
MDYIQDNNSVMKTDFRGALLTFRYSSHDVIAYKLLILNVITAHSHELIYDGRDLFRTL